MNELNLVRDLRADTPAITSAAEDAARTRLLDAIAMDSGDVPLLAGGSPTARRRPLWTAGLASVAVAAAAAVTIVTSSGSSPQLTSGMRPAAAAFLDKAAAVTASQPGARPKPDQWIYITSTNLVDPSHVEHDVLWLRADGQQLAFLQDGKLVVQHVSPSQAGGYSVVASYDTLAALPTDPHALLAAIAKLPAAGPGLGDDRVVHQILGAPGVAPLGNDRNSSSFLTLAYLIWNSPVGAPPAVRAALYRALAEIPVITIDTTAKTITGRRVVSLSGLLFDPETYQLVGARELWPQGGTRCSTHNVCTHVPAGTVMSEQLKSIKYVAGPGQH